MTLPTLKKKRKMRTVCSSGTFHSNAELLKVGQWHVLAQEDKSHAKNLLSIAMSSRAKSIEKKYQAAFVRLTNFATSKGFLFLPASPAQFIVYLEEVMKSTGSKSSVEEAYNAMCTWIHGNVGLQSPVEDGSQSSTRGSTKVVIQT